MLGLALKQLVALKGSLNAQVRRSNAQARHSSTPRWFKWSFRRLGCSSALGGDNMTISSILRVLNFSNSIFGCEGILINLDISNTKFWLQKFVTCSLRLLKIILIFFSNLYALSIYVAYLA